MSPDGEFESGRLIISYSPQPLSPNKPYLRPQFNSNFVSVKSSTPWNVIEKFSIFKSRDCGCDAKTPVHERFDKSNLTDAPSSVVFEWSTPFSVVSAAGFGFPLDCAAAFFFAWRFSPLLKAWFTFCAKNSKEKFSFRYTNANKNVDSIAPWSCAMCIILLFPGFLRLYTSKRRSLGLILSLVPVSMTTREDQGFSKWRWLERERWFPKVLIVLWHL